MHRLRFDVCSERGTDACHRDSLSNVPRSSHVALQLPLVLRKHHVRPWPQRYAGRFLTDRSSASWVSYGTERIPDTWSWRIPSILQGLPSAFQFFLVLLAPESPRWLVSKGKEDRALKTLAYYHADGNEQDPLVQYEFEEIKAAIALDRESECVCSVCLRNPSIRP